MLAGHDICSPAPGEQEAAAASWSQAAAGNYRLAHGLHRDKLISSKAHWCVCDNAMLERVESPAMIHAHPHQYSFILQEIEESTIPELRICTFNKIRNRQRCWS